MDLEVGDTATFEILGVEIKGIIHNIRSVKWTSFLPNFFIIFQPGFLEDAPKTYLSVIENLDFQKQLEIQDKIVEKFPNISIINVSEIIAKMINLFKAISWAIGIMSFCCIGVGVFVLFSILQSQMAQKTNEFALQKIMGMNFSSISKALLIEYSLIVFMALAIGSLVGLLLAYIVSYIFLDGVFIFNLEFFLVFNVGIYLLCLLIISITFFKNYKKSVAQLL